MQDLDQQLASELAPLPEARFTIADTMAAGRHAVRRRRLAAGGALLTAALVVAGTAWLVVPGEDPGSDSSMVAVEPSSAPSSGATGSTDPGATSTEPLVRGTDGEMVVNPAAEILEQDRWPSIKGKVFDIYHLRLDGGEYYAYTSPGESGSFPVPAQGLTLREWVEQSLEGSDIGDDEWVRFDSGSHVVAVLAGLRIVDQRPDPGLGANFAGPNDPTALVEVDFDGTTFFLAVRSLDGGPAEGIAYRRDDQIATIDQFRTFTLTQYADNESGGSEDLR